MTVPPCDNCGQPCAHGSGGSPEKPGTRKVIVLAILGGLAAHVLFIVITVIVLAGSTRNSIPTVGHSSVRHPLAGSLRPRLQACELFQQWQGTHRPRLLSQAITDAHSPRIPASPEFPWPTKSQFRTDFSGLLGWTPGGRSVQPPTVISFEQRVQADCTPVLAAWHRYQLHRDRPHRRHPNQPATVPSRIRRTVRTSLAGN